jgi:TIR domain
MDYELGLEQLKQQARGTSWFHEFSLYEGRLRENLNEERLYGTTEQTRSTKAKIIDQLNRLAYEHLHVSFVDLCIHKNIDQPKKTPHQSTTSQEQSHSDVLTQSVAVPQLISENVLLSSPPSVFVSYSHKDRNYLEELRVHLTPYIRANKVACWDDTEINPGAVWQEEIKASMQAATTAVLLVSAHFLASNFIANYELPYLLASAKSGNVTILSVIVRPCLFKGIDLAQLQAINAPSQPLSGMSNNERDKVWVKMVERIKNNL